MSTDQLHPNHVYVLRDLPVSSQAPRKGNMPPCLGRLVRVLEGGLLLMRLRTGGFGLSRARWSRFPRRVQASSVSREATPRELVVGMPI
jgi:hypothetical protein